MKHNYPKITLWVNFAFISVMMVLVGLWNVCPYELREFGIVVLLSELFVALLFVLFLFGAPMVAAQVCALEARDHSGSLRHFLTWLLALIQAPFSVALYMIGQLFFKLLNALHTQTTRAWVDWAINADELHAKLFGGCLILYSIGLVIACLRCRYSKGEKVFITVLMCWQVILWTLQFRMTLDWLRS